MSGVLLIAFVLAVLIAVLVLLARVLRADPEPAVDPEPAIGRSCYELAVLDHGDPADLELEPPAFSWPE